MALAVSSTVPLTMQPGCVRWWVDLLVGYRSPVIVGRGYFDDDGHEHSGL
jgi:hypothetical protein